VLLPTPSAWQITQRVGVALGSLSRHMVTARRQGALDQAAVAHAIRRTFDDLGGTFLKFGQLVASSPSLFGEDVATEFRGCLDSGPPIPFRSLRRSIERDLGRPLEEMFDHVERTPIAAASLAVVHRARLRDGTDVAIKVLRPGIRHALATDLATLRPIADFLGGQVAVGVAATLPGLIRGLAVQLAEEVDLENEARSIRWFRGLLEAIGARLIRVPHLYDDLCGHRTLTMELVDGVPVDSDDAIAAMGVDPKPALRECMRGWFAGLLAVGAFHGDIHAGNLLVCPDGRMAVLDWGIVGRVDADTGFFLRRLLEAVLGDDTGWVDVARHMETQYGGGLAEMLGVDEAGWVMFVKAYLQPLLSSPIGDVDLRTMLLGIGDVPQEKARSGVRDNVTWWWDERRRQRAMMASEGFGGGFDQATFLLGKQLIYFERYGKRYLPDVPLIDDPEAYRKLLEMMGRDLRAGGTAPDAARLDAAAGLLNPAAEGSGGNR
jgi:hypothetical protein